MFKLEPFVLHVQCKDLVAGQQMVRNIISSTYYNTLTIN